ncbi:hypothetical protein [uncultured Microscilla sp.]|uniref:hypothetical protein n=1 Tax=uncultured Microscilla sp. TaxID=432653 RepID=UPI002601C59D|nr:hypothetical protein [uncultured Microscilla sp.]
MNHTNFILRNGITGLLVFIVAALAMSYTISLSPNSKLNLQALLLVIAIPSGIAAGIFTALILLFKQQPNYLKAFLWIVIQVVIFIALTVRFL